MKVSSPAFRSSHRDEAEATEESKATAEPVSQIVFYVAPVVKVIGYREVGPSGRMERDRRGLHRPSASGSRAKPQPLNTNKRGRRIYWMATDRPLIN